MQTQDPALTKTPIDREGMSNPMDRECMSIENHTIINKGTDTFQESIVGSEHVNDGDNAARQPDRRDQEGNAFDDGINEHTTINKGAKSEGINDLNRYANIDNAQTRVLNPDEKDF